MLGIVALFGAYATTGQTVPGVSMTKSKALEKQVFLAEKWNGRLIDRSCCSQPSDLLTTYVFRHVLMTELSLMNDITPFHSNPMVFLPHRFCCSYRVNITCHQ